MQDSVFSIPAHSLLLTVDDELRRRYLVKIMEASKSLSSLAFSVHTGGYIRGLARSFNLPIEEAPRLAFLILRVLIGEKHLQDLSASLQQALGVSAVQAQAIAGDIEKELFAPVRKELDDFLAQKGQKRVDPPPLRKSDALPNTLDLRETNLNP